MSADLAQRERQVFCDLLVELGPGAATLCEGWTATDLAAHIVARERRPDSGPGLVWAPLAAHTDKVRRSLRDRTPWTDLVELVRAGPPLLLRPFDGPMNTVEFFIHVEDLRRAQPNWEPRTLAPELNDALWSRLGAGGMAKQVGVTVELRSAGRDAKRSDGAGQSPRAGQSRSAGTDGAGPPLVVEGDPGELTMFASGRQVAARVEIRGDDELADRLRRARLGI